MKVKKLAALCGLALATMGGQALAAEAHTQNALDNSRIAFVSGASAVKNSFGDMADALFDATAYPIVRYKSADGNFLAAVGKLKSGSGAWSGQDVAFIYRTLGGSVFGVEPVATTALNPGNGFAQGFAVDTLNLAATPSSGAGTAASPWVVTTDITLRPDAGIADLDPKFFVGPINTSSAVNVLLSNDLGDEASPDATPDLSGVVAEPLYLVGYGLAVTDNVPDSAIFTKAVVAGILSGKIHDWNQIEGSGVVAPASEDIVLCRRTPGSGTATNAHNYFLNQPFGASALTPIDRNDNPGSIWDGSGLTGTPGTGNDWKGIYFVNNASHGKTIVIENDGSGEVRTCLQKAIDASATNTIKFPDPVNSPVSVASQFYQADRTANANYKDITVGFASKVGGYKAVGILSTDSLGNAGGLTSTTKWNFRGFDGTGRIAIQSQANTPSAGITTEAVVTTPGATARFPTKANLINGAWDFVSWEALNVPTYTTGAKLSVINKLKDAARDPALLKIVGNTPTKFSFLPSTAVGIVWDANAGVITAVEPTDATAGHDHVSKSIFLNLDQTLPYYNAY